MDLELYRNILDATGCGYAYHKILRDKNNVPVDFVCLSCNKIYSDVLGLDTHEIVHQPFSQIPNSNNHLIKLYHEFISTQKNVEFEDIINLITKQYKVKIIKQDNDHFITVIDENFFNVQKVNETMADICREMHSKILVIRPDDKKIYYVNKEACAFFECSKEEILGRKFTDFVVSRKEAIGRNSAFPTHMTYIKTVDEYIDEAAKKGVGGGYLLQKTKTGKTRDTITNFSYIKAFNANSMMITIQDRTAIFEMAIALKEKELQYRTLFEDAPLAYQTIDKKCCIVSVNQEWLNMMGYKSDEVIGKSIFDIIADESKDMARITIKKFKSGDYDSTLHSSININLNLIKKDGSKISTGVKGRVQLDENNKFIQCNCIINDITPTLKAQEKEKALSKAKNEFLAIISHEVRTPLTTILGLNQLLMKTELSDIQHDYLQKISGAGTSLMGIINDMLDITKYESGKLDIESLPFDFDIFIENLITVYKMYAEKCGNSFEYELDENIPAHLIGDKLRLGQVLNNILSNAIKFTHMGTIHLSVRLMGRTKSDVDLQIIVRDSGIGMTKEQVAKLFIPFEQADTSFARKYGGSGLGLAISKQLIDLMGGNIKVESIHSEGTIFIINLSLPIDLAYNKRNSGVSQDKHRSKKLSDIAGKKVLVAEDHKINQKIICDILKFYDLELEVANNGLEATKKAEYTYYDLIFMDIQMPKMDGLCATKKIRSMKDERIKNTPILAMTAHAMEEEYTKSLKAGMNGHITKPINIEVLENYLIKYLADEQDYVQKSNILDFKSCTEGETIDIRMGLIRFHHDAEAYKSSLTEFLQYKQADVELLSALNENKLEDALRFLHSIKGIAGNLSMNHLSRASHQLKIYLSEKVNRFNNGDISCFSTNLDNVITSIENGDVFKKIDNIMSKYVHQ